MPFIQLLKRFFMPNQFMSKTASITSTVIFFEFADGKTTKFIYPYFMYESELSPVLDVLLSEFSGIKFKQPIQVIRVNKAGSITQETINFLPLDD